MDGRKSFRPKHNTRDISRIRHMYVWQAFTEIYSEKTGEKRRSQCNHNGVEGNGGMEEIQDSLRLPSCCIILERTRPQPERDEVSFSLGMLICLCSRVSETSRNSREAQHDKETEREGWWYEWRQTRSREEEWLTHRRKNKIRSEIHNRQHRKGLTSFYCLVTSSFKSTTHQQTT